MNAETTADRVLVWAVQMHERPADAADPPPMPPAGPLRHSAALGTPSTAITGRLAELIRRAGARLGTGSPPFGDASIAGPGALLMAAAVGGRAQPGPAGLLAEAVPSQLAADAEPQGWADALARHAVVGPAVAALGNTRADSREDPLMETLLRYSPLTAVLHRPPLAALDASATGGATAVARALAARPRGTAVLLGALSGFVPDAAVLRWRTELLTRWMPERPELVVDVYLAARLRHGARWDEQVNRARRAFRGAEGPDALSLAAVRFWRPLALLRRRRPDLLSARPLMTGHRPVLSLVEGRHAASIAASA